MTKKVGVIGLGAMGLGVARNLVREGFSVYGCDVREAARDAFAGDGGIACGTPAALGAECEAVIVLVVNAEQTESVLFGERGAADAMRPGSAVIASATVAPAFAKALGERLAAKRIALLDAPVTGGVTGAAEATLTLLTSGPRAVSRTAAARR